MRHFLLICSAIFVFFLQTVFAQIPIATHVQIVRSEDERRFDQTLENLLTSPNEKIRVRAALAAGRIGDERAVPLLTKLLQSDSSTEVGSMAAFALGEIESAKAADAIVEILNNRNHPPQIRARALEAAGKIAAANTKDEKYKQLGEAILQALDFEAKRRSGPDRDIILFGLTAALRARPTDAEKVVIEFLGYSDARIRADALNTLARLRAKNANQQARELLQKDIDSIVRANAARVLGAAEDKDALGLLLKAATTDADSRVRVSAIRSLASLREVNTAERLLNHGNRLLKDYTSSKISAGFPKEKNELLEVATALGNILRNTDDERAIEFLNTLRETDNFTSPETEIALARIAPIIYGESIIYPRKYIDVKDWRGSSAVFQGVGEIAKVEENEKNKDLLREIRFMLLKQVEGWFWKRRSVMPFNNYNLAIPDLLRTYAAFYPKDSLDILIEVLEREKDATIRATIAGLMGERPATKRKVEALKKAFSKSILTDKHDNDAQLAILSALVKLDKPQSYESLRIALKAPDYLIRRHAANLIRENNLTKDFSNVEKMVGTVKLYNTATKTKLGQVLNSNADYIRAVSRKSAKAIVTTAKGNFTIEFFPEEAPLTVDNFIRLARSGYFNNLTIHRVVPNFVMQDGDPRGDGSGGPGWSIRCEINQIQYERGMVGMALSGKDTGGSQWFVTHSPQPHLDGGYTVFGRVNETDMKIVDNLVRGDKILSVKIVEGNAPLKSAKAGRK